MVSERASSRTAKPLITSVPVKAESQSQLRKIERLSKGLSQTGVQFVQSRTKEAQRLSARLGKSLKKTVKGSVRKNTAALDRLFKICRLLQVQDLRASKQEEEDLQQQMEDLLKEMRGSQESACSCRGAGTEQVEDGDRKGWFAWDRIALAQEVKLLGANRRRNRISA